MARYMSGVPGNASSVHAAGRSARHALEEARERIAAAVGADRGEIVFTSGGTEADNLAVLGRWRHAGSGVAISAVEHSAVRGSAAQAAREGAALTTLAVTEDGRLDPGALDEALENELAVVSVMWANNEVGVIQPVEHIAERCAEAGVVFHTDAVQAVGHIPVDVRQVPCDLMAFTAHKLGGPTGVGALFVRRGTGLAPLLLGGGHEGGIRAGTSNVGGAVGFAAALDAAVEDMAAESIRLAGLRDQMEATFRERVPGVRVHGEGANRLPHIVNLGLDGVPADVIMASLDMAGLAVSSGSACSSGAAEPSHVLVAMGQEADATVRFSLGWSTTGAHVDEALARFLDVLDRARAVA